MVTEVRHRLKELRKRAALRSRDMAQAIGMHPSTYQKYEDRRQGVFLPLDMVAKLVIALKPRGIDPIEIWDLAKREDIVSFHRAWSMTKTSDCLGEIDFLADMMRKSKNNSDEDNEHGKKLTRS